MDSSNSKLEELYLSPMELMSFKEYLIKKKIDAMAFAKSRPEQYAELKKVFDQVHPDSFTAQKLFLINPIRREFPFKEEIEVKEKKKPMARPKIVRPNPKR